MRALPLLADLRSRLAELEQFAAGFVPDDTVKARHDRGRIALQNAYQDTQDAFEALGTALPPELGRRLKALATHLFELHGALAKLACIAGPEDKDGGYWRREAARSDVFEACRAVASCLGFLENELKARVTKHE